MKIFSGSSNKELALKIAKQLDITLSPLEIFVFPDGEKRIRVGERVLGQDCVLVQSTGMPVDSNYMELFLIVDALKRSGAKSVKLVMPYFGYQRQDHIFRDGEDVSLEVIAKTLESVGITDLFSFDLHTPKIPELFKIPVIHLSALLLFSENIKKEFDLKKIVLVTPDMGGIGRIKKISELLGNIPFATIVKDRDLASGDIKDSGLDGQVDGKICVMVDDMISTGNTMADAADLLLENGGQKVFAYATHAVLAGEASNILQNCKIGKVIVSDSLEIPKEKEFEKLEILSIAEIAAKALKNF
nr:ribose-phosphate pyrophosphokinase [Candidatus Levybacteria bacterium]